MLRLLNAPDLPTELGWGEVLTPLGASAHAEINSAAWEMCEDWRIQESGRRVVPTRERVYFWYAGLISTAPAGLVAELLWAASCELEFVVLLRKSPEARQHVLALPDSQFAADEGEVLQLGAAVELASIVAAQAAGKVAVLEALATTGDWPGAMSRLVRDTELRRSVVEMWSCTSDERLAKLFESATALEASQTEPPRNLATLKDFANAGDVIAAERLLLTSPEVNREAARELTREPRGLLAAVDHLACSLIDNQGHAA